MWAGNLPPVLFLVNKAAEPFPHPSPQDLEPQVQALQEGKVVEITAEPQLKSFRMYGFFGAFCLAAGTLAFCQLIGFPYQATES